MKSRPVPAKSWHDDTIYAELLLVVFFLMNVSTPRIDRKIRGKDSSTLVLTFGLCINHVGPSPQANRQPCAKGPHLSQSVEVKAEPQGQKAGADLALPKWPSKQYLNPSATSFPLLRPRHLELGPPWQPPGEAIDPSPQQGCLAAPNVAPTPLSNGRGNALSSHGSI